MPRQRVAPHLGHRAVLVTAGSQTQHPIRQTNLVVREKKTEVLSGPVVNSTFIPDLRVLGLLLAWD